MKFINQNPHPVNVTRPDGSPRVVRPFRELQAFGWRTAEDCICEGPHYARFPGLLEPFREPDDANPQASPAAPAVTAVAGDAVVGSPALSGRFRASGDVVRPDGSVRKDAPEGNVATPGPDADADGDGQDDDFDAPLENVRGVGPKVADALRANGYKTARDLARVEGDDAMAALAAVPFVRNCRLLVESARQLLQDG